MGYRTMARPKSIHPTYRLHRKSGRGRAAWTDAAGIEHSKLFPGPFKSPESEAAYRRFIREFDTSPQSVTTPNPNGITVAEVLLAYVDHADSYYRTPTGEHGGELERVNVIVKILDDLYGTTPAAQFGPVALKAVRAEFEARGWCRRSVNQQTERVRRIFKWAVSESLIPVTVYTALTTVAGLKSGRCKAHETEPIRPVDDAIIEATIEHLNRHVAGLLRFMRLTGCRPGEAARVRRSEIDMAGSTWVYRPKQHKNRHRGKSRTIYIGPAAQALLRTFFTTDIDDYLFSPVRATAEIREERAARRKTPRYPSHMKRNAAKRVSKPKRTPAEFYNRIALHTAIARACDKAFPAPAPLRQRDGETTAQWNARLTSEQRKELAGWQRKHHWHPNQIRHTFATHIRREHGLEAAQVLLGHAKADVTQVYAERDTERATQIISRIG
jgi:integrase